MEPIEAVENALAVTGSRLAVMPSFGIYQSIQFQLNYLLGVLRGTEVDRSRLKEINFGVYAAKEFEDSDPELAQALHPAFWVATQMAKGVKVSNVPV
jgi:hypothetical protein